MQMNFFYRPTRMLIFMISLITGIHSVQSQKNAVFFNSRSAVQYGYGVKLTADISKLEQLSFRLGFTSGLGAYWGGNWLYPTLNGDLMVFRGGLGSAYPGNKSRFLDVEAIVSYMITTGFNNRLNQTSKARPGLRNYPLYYMNTWNLPALQNPFRWSASVGGNLVFFFSRYSHRFQSVGFANLHFDRLQANYINDGPPFFPPLGDRYDRLHTGGGFLSFHGNDHWAVNLVELGFNKFTGFSPSSYELTNKIGGSYVFYKDKRENYYNKSNWQLTVGNTAKHWAVSAIVYNYPRFDVQHRIHNITYDPLHLVPYKKTVAIGGATYFQQTKIGLQ